MKTSADTSCGHCKYENLVRIERVSSRSGLTPLHFALSVKYESGMTEVWRNYMEHLMNVENSRDGHTECEVKEGPRCLISQAEVTSALLLSNRGKSTGRSGVAAELILASGTFGVEWLTDLCIDILEGLIPSDWTLSAVVPLYTGKGDPLTCGSYRAIKLLEHAMKVYERILEKRVREQVAIDEMQFGFMPGKGTIDAIFTVSPDARKVSCEEEAVVLCFC